MHTYPMYCTAPHCLLIAQSNIAQHTLAWVWIEIDSVMLWGWCSFVSIVISNYIYIYIFYDALWSQQVSVQLDDGHVCVARQRVNCRKLCCRRNCRLMSPSVSDGLGGVFFWEASERCQTLVCPLSFLLANKLTRRRVWRMRGRKRRRRRINLDHHQISRAMLGCIKATSPANEGQTGEGGRGWWERAEGWTAGLCGGAADRWKRAMRGETLAMAKINNE